MEQAAGVLKACMLRGEYTFTIEHFSLLDSRLGQFVDSPDFKLTENSWWLRVFPGGKEVDEADNVSVKLCNGCTEKVTARMRIDIVDASGGPLRMGSSIFHDFGPFRGGVGNSEVGLRLPRAELFSPERGFVPNDTLRLKLVVERTAHKTENVPMSTVQEPKPDFKSVVDSIGRLLESGENRYRNA